MNQTQFAIDQSEFPVNPELESIMKEQRDIAAKKLVDDLNMKFFESVAAWLVDWQQITFHDKDGSRYIIKNGSVKILDQEGVDFIEHENWKHICPNCKRKVEKLRISFDNSLLSSAIKAFEYAVKNGVKYVQMNKLWLTKVEYSTMNRLVKFGLAFRNEEILIDWTNRGVYWIPRKRIFDFIQWNWSVAESFLQDPTLPEWHKHRREMSKKRITIDQVPSIQKLREKYGETLTTYEWTEPDDFFEENLSE